MRIDEELGRDPGADLERQAAAARAKEPERDAAMSLVIECWQTLASARPVVPVGMGGSYRGEIPFPAIDAWARRWGLDDEHALLVVDVVRQLDADRTERIHDRLATKG